MHKALTLALCISSCIAFDPTFTEYRNILPRLRFPQYSQQDQQHLADQIHNLFQIYVNRESKIDNYGYDPLPEVQRIKENAATMNSEELQLSSAKLFLGLRDFHSNYFMPAPYACYGSAFPIALTILNSDDFKNPRVAVKGFLAMALKFNAGINSTVHIGDELVSIDGLTFPEFVNKNKHLHGGSNDYGSAKSALNYLLFRSGQTHPLDNVTQITYAFKKWESDEVYSIVANIVGVIDNNCLATAGAKQRGSRPAVFPQFRPVVPFHQQFDMMSNPNLYMHNFLQKDLFAKLTPIIFNSTEQSIIKWAIYHSDVGRVGILKLESFVPEGQSTRVEEVLGIIRGLLLNELKDTDCLVIDIRNNPGGLASMADSIPQFFTNDHDPANTRALMSDINGRIFDQPLFKDGDWDLAYRNTPPNSTYSNTVKFNSREESYTYGQVYFKPVGLFTNADCYSACDFFSAAMQDSNAAIIFGEDPQTGGGGANVVEYGGFLRKILNETFLPLPGGQDMRVSWRQALRTGLNSGKLIEDFGVFADHVIRPEISDLEGTTRTQWDRISRMLIQNGKETGKDTLHYPSFDLDMEVGSKASFDFSAAGVTRVELWLNGTMIGESNVEKSDTPIEYKLSSNNTTEKVIEETYEFVGYRNDKMVFSSKRAVRFTPKIADFLTLEAGVQHSFNISDAYGAVYNDAQTADSQGWNQIGPFIIIGETPGPYDPNVKSALTLFVNVLNVTQPVKSECVMSVRQFAMQASHEAWSTLEDTFIKNNNYTLDNIMDEEIAIGTYFDIARELIAASLNKNSGSPVSQPVLDAMNATRFALETYKVQELATDINITLTATSSYTPDELLKILREYNNGESTEVTGNPTKCMASSNPMLKIGALFALKPQEDFFIVAIRTADGTNILTAASQAGRIDQEIPLTTWAGQSIEIVLQFISSSRMGGGPVAVTELTLSA